MKNNKEAINRRFISSIDLLLSNRIEKSKKVIAEKLKIGNSKLSEILNERMSAGAELIADFCMIYHFNTDWMLTGRGKMHHMLLADGDKNRKIEDNFIVYGRENIPDKVPEEQIIPVYNIKASEGLSSLFENSNIIFPLDYLRLPNIGMSDGAVFAIGDSMYPLIKQGDLVVYRQINHEDQSILWGEMYLLSYDLEGEEIITIRYVLKSETDGYIRLAGMNAMHSPQDIHFSKIKAMALVKATVHYSLGSSI